VHAMRISPQQALLALAANAKGRSNAVGTPRLRRESPAALCEATCAPKPCGLQCGAGKAHG
jgi:hypothetical protein